MIQPLTQFADSSSGIGALGFDGNAFLIQLITFLLAFWILERYAFKPILKIMQQRRETIESGVALGEQMKQERAELEKKVGQMIHDARVQADGIIANAQEAGKDAIKEAEDKARSKAAGILKEAEARIEQDTARARKTLEKELVGLISDATEAIIQEKVDAKKDASLIERALKGRAT
jgi:F-type H+-transporting ATPase subunit b